MERFSQRESVLLGYNLQRPLMNMNSGSSKTSKPFRNSDVDFHDVFGGPPRRFSMQEVRPNFKVIDDEDEDDDDEDEPWSALNNKPVFGDDGVSRRRLPSADFFADIFGGETSVHSTPKWHGRDYVFPASPGSRVLSPLPPKAEHFETASFPSQFSLPGKMSKAMEVPMFGSSSRGQHKHKDGSPNGIPHSLSSGSTLSRFSTEAIQANDARSSRQLNSLFQGSSLSSEDSLKSDKEEGNLKKDSESSGNSNNNTGHFHFSIYKWKSKGVPLDIPLRGKASRSKDLAKSEQLSGSHDDDKSRIASQASDKTPSIESSTTTSEHSNKLQNGLSHDEKTPSSIKDEPAKSIGAKPEVKSVHSNKLKNGVSLEEFAAEKKTPSTMKDEPAKGISASKEEPQKPEVKSVHSLFYDDLEKGLGDTAKTGDQKKSMNNGTKVSFSPGVGYTKTTKKQEKVNGIQSSPKVESNGRSRVKGKVKDFVKMFNQEPSPKAKDSHVFRSKSCKWNEKCHIEDEERISTSVKEEKFQMPKVKEDPKQSAKVHATEQDSSTSSPDSLSDAHKATVEETDESVHDNFQVKEITPDENGKLESITHNQEFMDIDAKIRQWTKGKEGNIRSLLSTLQFVLWAESGWKPVPLVDIIEGSSVKRAYQKALLCLHPDKLQQKGAASHQKYLAEKVFDILQEAWNYFNSLGAV